MCKLPGRSVPGVILNNLFFQKNLKNVKKICLQKIIKNSLTLNVITTITIITTITTTITAVTITLTKLKHRSKHLFKQDPLKARSHGFLR